MTDKKKVLILYAVTLAGMFVWMAALFLAPYSKSQSSPWGQFLYSVFSPVCHQIPERSFHFCGFPLAVCSRCTGIYAGALLGLFLFPFVKGFRSVSPPPTRHFVVLTIPIVVDTIGNMTSLWTTLPWLRFFIGAFWGLILPFYFISGLSDAWIKLKAQNKS